MSLKEPFDTALPAEADAAGAGPAEALRTLLPWRLLGMGLLIAWLCCTHLPDMFMNGLAPQGSHAVDYALRFGDIGVFVVVATLGGRFGPVSSHPVWCAVAVALSCVGTLGLPAMANAGAGTLALALASAATGTGGAVLFLLWGQTYGRLGSLRCLAFGGGSCVLAGLVALALTRMDATSSLVATALLPALSGALAAASLAYLPSPRGVAPAPSHAVPVKLVALMSFAGFTSGFAGSILVSEADHIGAVHRIESTALIGVAILGALALRRGRLDARALAWATLPVALASFLLIPFLGQSAGSALSFLVKLTYVAFALFALAMIANLVWRFAVPSDRVFAFARASSETAMLAGILLRRALSSAGALDSQATLWLIALIGMAAIVGCVLLWHSERSVTSDWGVMGIDPTSGMRLPSPRERALARCEELASEHGLTPREAEVLALIAQGSQPSDVERALYLSHNTLKTHLRHVYAKLGVHSMEELRELARAEGGGMDKPAHPA